MSTPTQDSFLSTRPTPISSNHRPTLQRVPSATSLASSRSSPSSSQMLPPASQSSLPTAEQWIVQKYGGTSVGKFLPAITSQIVPSYLAAAASTTDVGERRLRIALVCSARSGSTKAKGTTNLLLKAATQALETASDGDVDLAASALNLGLSADGSHSRFDNSSKRSASSSSSASASSLPPRLPFEETVDVLLEEHLIAAGIAVKNDDNLRQSLESDIRSDCERLRQFLQAAKVRP